MKKFLRDQRGNFGLVLKQYYGFEIGRQVFITAACDYMFWKTIVFSNNPALIYKHITQR